MTLSDWRNEYFSKLDPFLGNEEVHSSILCGSTMFPENQSEPPPQPRATKVTCAGLRPTSLA